MAQRLTKPNDKESLRLEVVRLLDKNRISLESAAEMLNVTTRQVSRIVNRYYKEGPIGIRSKRIGKPSNNTISDSIKKKAISLIKTKYSDLGPTAAHRKLTEKHGLTLSVETLRKLMMSHKLW